MWLDKSKDFFPPPPGQGSSPPAPPPRAVVRPPHPSGSPVGIPTPCWREWWRGSAPVQAPVSPAAPASAVPPGGPEGPPNWAHGVPVPLKYPAYPDRRPAPSGTPHTPWRGGAGPRPSPPAPPAAGQSGRRGPGIGPCSTGTGRDTGTAHPAGSPPPRPSEPPIARRPW